MTRKKKNKRKNKNKNRNKSKSTSVRHQTSRSTQSQSVPDQFTQFYREKKYKECFELVCHHVNSNSIDPRSIPARELATTAIIVAELQPIGPWSTQFIDQIKKLKLDEEFNLCFKLIHLLSCERNVKPYVDEGLTLTRPHTGLFDIAKLVVQPTRKVEDLTPTKFRQLIKKTINPVWSDWTVKTVCDYARLIWAYKHNAKITLSAAVRETRDIGLVSANAIIGLVQNKVPLNSFNTDHRHFRPSSMCSARVLASWHERPDNAFEFMCRFTEPQWFSRELYQTLFDQYPRHRIKHNSPVLPGENVSGNAMVRENPLRVAASYERKIENNTVTGQDFIDFCMRFYDDKKVPVTLIAKMLRFAITEINQLLSEKRIRPAAELSHAGFELLLLVKERYSSRMIKAHFDYPRVKEYFETLFFRLASIETIIEEPEALIGQVSAAKRQLSEEDYVCFLQALDTKNNKLESPFWSKLYNPEKTLNELPNGKVHPILAAELLFHRATKNRPYWYFVAALTHDNNKDLQAVAERNGELKQYKSIEELISVIVSHPERKNFKRSRFNMPEQFASFIQTLLEIGYRFWSHDAYLQKLKPYTRSRIQLLNKVIDSTLDIPTDSRNFKYLDPNRFATVILNYCALLSHLKSLSISTSPRNWKAFIERSQSTANPITLAVLSCFAGDLTGAKSAIRASLKPLKRGKKHTVISGTELFSTIICLGQLAQIFNKSIPETQKWLEAGLKILKPELAKLDEDLIEEIYDKLSDKWNPFESRADMSYPWLVNLHHALKQGNASKRLIEKLQDTFTEFELVDSNGMIAPESRDIFLEVLDEDDEEDFLGFDPLAALSEFSPQQMKHGSFEDMFTEIQQMAEHLGNLEKAGIAPPGMVDQLLNSAPAEIRTILKAMLGL